MENILEKNPLDGEKEKRVLRHSEGRQSKVRFEGGEKIGEGHYGEVYVTQLSLERAQAEKDEARIKEIKKTFAVKEFKGSKESGKGLAEEALKKYEKLKELGIHTFSTYRVIEGENKIIMTDLSSPDSLVLSASLTDNSAGKNFFHSQEDPIDELGATPELLQRLVEDVLKAARGGLRIAGDAFFYKLSVPSKRDKKPLFLYKALHALTANLVKEKVKTSVLEDVVVGDFDNVEIFEKVDDKRDLRLENLVAVRASFLMFLSEYSSPSAKKKNLTLFDEIIRSVLPESTAEAELEKIREKSKMKFEDE
jgi:hypothetical protein